MILPGKIEIQFGEISVFPVEFAAPCHDWTEDDVAQGFCWNGTQVAFLTLQYEGVLEVTIEIESKFELRRDAIRAIQVPIFIREDFDVAIWPNPKTWYSIPEGEYCLVFQTGLKPFISESRKKQGDFTAQWEHMWCVLTFIRRDKVKAKILRQDGKLNPPEQLFTVRPSRKPPIRRRPSH